VARRLFAVGGIETTRARIRPADKFNAVIAVIHPSPAFLPSFLPSPAPSSREFLGR